MRTIHAYITLSHRLALFLLSQPLAHPLHPHIRGEIGDSPLLTIREAEQGLFDEDIPFWVEVRDGVHGNSDCDHAV